jgi:hypothetical protein
LKEKQQKGEWGENAKIFFYHTVLPARRRRVMKGCGQAGFEMLEISGELILIIYNSLTSTVFLETVKAVFVLNFLVSTFTSVTGHSVSTAISTSTTLLSCTLPESNRLFMAKTLL